MPTMPTMDVELPAYAEEAAEEAEQAQLALPPNNQLQLAVFVPNQDAVVVFVPEQDIHVPRSLEFFKSDGNLFLQVGGFQKIGD